MDNEIKDNNVKILKWTIMIMIFVPIILIVLFYLWFFNEAVKVHDDISVYDNQNNLIYDSEKENQIVEVIDNTTTINIEENKNRSLEYYEENGNYYTDIDEKTKIISPEMACDIADKEAKKDIYQYQDWESDFYTRAEENNYQMAIELKNGININNLNWEDNWKKTTDYEDKLTWSVRLFDRNDPLTSLFIYIDATNGNILGAGKLSD